VLRDDLAYDNLAHARVNELSNENGIGFPQHGHMLVHDFELVSPWKIPVVISVY
jgi:hypothetical protein